MNSRERTFAALRFEEPDRVPIDFWASSGFRRKLRDELGLGFDAFLDLHDVDLRYIDGPGYKGPELRRREDGAQADISPAPRTTCRPTSLSQTPRHYWMPITRSGATTGPSRLK